MSKEDACFVDWIDVDDRLPSDPTWNLIFTEGMVTMAFFEMCGDEFYWLAHNDRKDSDEWTNVSHWAYLPKPPTIEEK